MRSPAARPDTPPITLQGPWTAEDRPIPPWKGDYHHDLNTQLSYWPCYGGNRLEDGLAYLDWLWKTRDTAFDWTRRFYGLPGLNVPMTADLNGRLFPFGFVKLLWRLRNPRVKRVRVPLMGVTKRLHGTRLAGQIAYTLIESIRRACVEHYGVKHGEFGWVLEDNQGMMSIAELPGATINHVYRVFQKGL